MKVFVLSIQGIGDDEDSYCVSGVYSTNAKAEAAAKEILADIYDSEELPLFADSYEIEEHIVK